MTKLMNLFRLQIDTTEALYKSRKSLDFLREQRNTLFLLTTFGNSFWE